MTRSRRTVRSRTPRATGNDGAEATRKFYWQHSARGAAGGTAARLGPSPVVDYAFRRHPLRMIQVAIDNAIAKKASVIVKLTPMCTSA